MAKYVDGFVLVIPNNKLKEYRKMAEEGRDIWMKYGALSYFECMGDDLKPTATGGLKQLGFKKMANAKSNETVWFSFIIYKSKKHRDEVSKKVGKAMDEIYKDATNFSMPFDMSRMAQGGFSVEIEG